VNEARARTESRGPRERGNRGGDSGNRW
jgi:hypothetical protein